MGIFADLVNNSEPTESSSTKNTNVGDSEGSSPSEAKSPSVPSREEVEKQNLYDVDEVIAANFRQSNSLYLAAKAHAIGKTSSHLPSIENREAAYNYLMDNPLIDPMEVLNTFPEEDPNFNLQEALVESAIDEEDKHFFSSVVNRRQFENAKEYLWEDKRDRRILNDTSFGREMALSVVAGIADPLNWIPIAKGIKYGSTAVKFGIEGAIVGAADATLRGYVNDAFDAEEVALTTVASGLTSCVFGTAISKVSSSYKEMVQDFKDALIPNVSRWFEMENGELKEVSQGAFGVVKQKAKRWMWKMVNNSPTMQMYNSGDETLRKLSPLLFRERHTNLNDGQVVPISAEERINLTYANEVKMAERIAEYKKKYLHEGIGTAEAFDKEVAETIINTYVDINSGEMYPGGGASDDGNVRDAAKEYMGFWRDIIKRAKDYGVLEKEFGEGGITVERNVLTSEMANMSAEDFAKAVQEGTLEKTKVVALGHIARRYNSFNITADISNFRGILARNIHMNDQKLTPDEIDKVINNMIAKLINKDVKVRSAAFDDLPFGVKFTKEREIAISDEVLSKGGYLNYNIVGQELGSWRGLVAETELNRAARNIGFENWSDLKKIYEKAATEKVGEVHSKVAQKREIYRKIKLKVRSL